MTTESQRAARFSCESLKAVRAAGIEPLLARHFIELATFDDVPLEVDWAAYSRVEAIGALRIFTVRIAEELVGYAVYFVSRNPHWPLLQATQDVFYVVPERRGARLGVGLITFCEDMLSREGVQLVIQRGKVPPGPDSTVIDMGPLLARLGYAAIDTAWAKRLDRKTE